MTLFELLDELKRVDLETYRKWFNDYDILGLDQWQLDSLQGCIQRACERRGWTWKVFKQTADNEKSHCGEIGKVAPGYEGYYYEQCHEYCMASIEADYAAEALLAAYIAAVREEAK